MYSKSESRERCIIKKSNFFIYSSHNRDIILLRGAVFFIGMSIWGSKRVSSLKYSPLHVLPSFKICLQCNHHLVAHEVVLSLQRLVKKFGGEQEIITWDIIIDIVECLLLMIDVSVELLVGLLRIFRNTKWYFGIFFF